MHAQDALSCRRPRRRARARDHALGLLVARLRTSGEIARGAIFVPIHWSAANSSDARVGALVNPVSTPFPASRSSNTRPRASSPFASMVRFHPEPRRPLAGASTRRGGRGLAARVSSATNSPAVASCRHGPHASSRPPVRIISTIATPLQACIASRFWSMLADHLVDALLDVAVSGVNRVEREGISHTHPARFVLVASMNPEEGELRPQLLDRFGLAVDIEMSTDPDERVVAVRRQLGADGDEASLTEYRVADDALRDRLRATRTAAVPDAVLAVGVAGGRGGRCRGAARRSHAVPGRGRARRLGRSGRRRRGRPAPGGAVRPRAPAPAHPVRRARHHARRARRRLRAAGPARDVRRYRGRGARRGDRAGPGRCRPAAPARREPVARQRERPSRPGDHRPVRARRARDRGVDLVRGRRQRGGGRDAPGRSTPTPPPRSRISARPCARSAPATSSCSSSTCRARWARSGASPPPSRWRSSFSQMPTGAATGCARDVPGRRGRRGAAPDRLDRGGAGAARRRARRRRDAARARTRRRAHPRRGRGGATGGWSRSSSSSPTAGPPVGARTRSRQRTRRPTASPPPPFPRSSSTPRPASPVSGSRGSWHAGSAPAACPSTSSPRRTSPRGVERRRDRHGGPGADARHRHRAHGAGQAPRAGVDDRARTVGAAGPVDLLPRRVAARP